ncbi:MEST-like protein [Mya arenaria]|uniref:MEST-like protein n=1 Tax=Mya arenaria TaxID=6604 RepID=A0ABY7G6E6_MYAAR|nr:MEST-like protein [Mya arenaria]
MGYQNIAWIVVVTAATVYFLNIPPPPLSSTLLNWQKKGDIFKYKGFDIFYIVEEGVPSDGSTLLEHDYLITEQADIHEALLTSLSIPRAHVMSHDYGDTVALELLHRLIKYITQRAENKDRWVGALVKTKLPVHMIYGPSDPVNSGYAFVDHYKKVVPSPSITVLDAAIGHYPQWEDPNAVFESYKSFLQSIKKT